MKIISRILLVCALGLLLPAVVSGCNDPNSDAATRNAAPPPGPNARPDPPNPDKQKTMPGAAAPAGGS